MRNENNWSVCVCVMSREVYSNANWQMIECFICMNVSNVNEQCCRMQITNTHKLSNGNISKQCNINWSVRQYYNLIIVENHCTRTFIHFIYAHIVCVCVCVCVL